MYWVRFRVVTFRIIDNHKCSFFFPHHVHVPMILICRTHTHRGGSILLYLHATLMSLTSENFSLRIHTSDRYSEYCAARRNLKHKKDQTTCNALYCCIESNPIVSAGIIHFDTAQFVFLSLDGHRRNFCGIYSVQHTIVSQCLSLIRHEQPCATSTKRLP